MSTGVKVAVNSTLQIGIFRRYRIKDGVVSDIYLNGSICFSGLENDKTLIPVGIYDAKVRVSKKLGNVIELIKVPGRSAILLHVGNYPSDSKGCVLVGLFAATASILHSRRAMNLLYIIALNYSRILVTVTAADESLK